MKKMILLIIPCLLLASLAWQSPASEEDWRSKVDLQVFSEIEQRGETEILLLLTAQADPILRSGQLSKEEKGKAVYEQLKRNAQRSQQELIRMLEQENAFYRSFFIVNAIYARVDLPLIRKLASRPEVANIQPNPQVRLEEPLPYRDELQFRNQIEWGIEKINADDVWNMGFTGQGVVVGGQDTGVEWEHPAIKNQYRGWNGISVDHTYNWHDAIHEINPLHNDPVPDPGNNPCGLNSETPCDDHNHGTHTVGTMVGDDGQGNQIGVAPGARWIACRNMERGYGSPATYIECFEWFLAPTDLNGENPDPAKAPDVINNSWSCPTIEGCNESNWATMEMVVNNLKAAGIVVVVSAGNSGSGCGSVSTPAAMFANSFTVGASRQNDTIAGFSSRGPVLVDGSGRLKPNVVAPGTGVRSAIRNDNYATWNGTSMAGPHAAGLVALLISANPDLRGQVETIETIVEQSARTMLSDQDCNAISGLEVPNAVYGFGRIDALAAVEAALELVVDVAPEPEATRIEVFPNPFTGILTFRSTNLQGNFLLRIYNGAGQQVASGNWISATANQYEMNLSQLPAGLYFYQLSKGDQIFSGKLIKK